MPRTTISQLMRDNIYVVVYGPEGSGKTLLAMTLADANGYGVGYITADQSGPTSIVSMGYPSDIPVHLLPDEEHDPFPAAVAAIEDFMKDPKIHAICLDGVTVICGRAVSHFTNGEGEKAMGWDGWGYVLNGFKQIEQACDRATRKGKSVIITGWESAPEYEETLGGRALKSQGCMWLQGKAKAWLPGNADIVARMTSSFKSVKDEKTGKAVKTFTPVLQVNASEEWRAKTRWKLPDPCPANLQTILAMVRGQSESAKRPAGLTKNLKVVKK